MNFLCAIGLHKRVQTDKWTPSIAAKVVTEFEHTNKCDRCGKVLHHAHLRWDGKDMVKVNANNPDQGPPNGGPAGS